MASEAAHLSKAESNQRFLETISDEFPDWLAVVAFYRAVHLVEALFARLGANSHSHQHRNRRLKREYPTIWIHFRPLLDASLLLRYTDSRIDPEVVRRELIAHRLHAVERLIRKELAMR